MSMHSHTEMNNTIQQQNNTIQQLTDDQQNLWAKIDDLTNRNQRLEAIVYGTSSNDNEQMIITTNQIGNIVPTTTNYAN